MERIIEFLELNLSYMLASGFGAGVFIVGMSLLISYMVGKVQEFFSS
ncbi:MAG: hypothetical protein NC313_16635 [Butyrivibrio sp.]|nr:hypothetical protein [Butyrivibrio sp.]